MLEGKGNSTLNYFTFLKINTLICFYSCINESYIYCYITSSFNVAFAAWFAGILPSWSPNLKIIYKYWARSLWEDLTKVLWLSRFFLNYQFISFGGCFLNFWWFERSRSCFYFLVTVSLLSVCQLSLSTKKNLALIFQTQHSYLHYSKREVICLCYSF